VKAEKKSDSTPLPMPFQLPVNYPIVVEEGLKKGLLNGQAFTKLIMCISSAIFCHKSYPTKAEYHHVISQMLDKYPFIVPKEKKGSEDPFVSMHIFCIFFEYKPPLNKQSHYIPGCLSIVENKCLVSFRSLGFYLKPFLIAIVL